MSALKLSFVPVLAILLMAPLLYVAVGGLGPSPEGIVPAGPAVPPAFPVVHRAGGIVLDPSAFSASLPVFDQRYVGDGKAWEPTMGIAPDGTAYFMGASEYVPATGVQDVDALQVDRPRVFRSEDQGLSWTDVSPRLVYPDGTVPSLVSGETATPAQSGDPFIHVDPLTGRLFNYHQQAYVLCDHWAVSATRGETWDQWDTCQASLLEDESWGDHPSVVTGVPRAHATTGYPNALYFCASNGCRASFDSGASWTEPVPITDCGEHQLGHLATGPDGRVYVPHKDCGGARLAISEDDGQTWTDVVVDDTVWTTAQEPWEGWDHDASVAADAAGNLYYFWMSDEHLPYVAVSTDHGTTWGEPLAVAAPGVTYALFPQVVAGDEGRIAFMYWATDVPSGSRDDPAAVWRVYVGTSLDALAEDPVFATTLAHPADDPVRRGPCINFRCYIAPGPLGNGVPNEGVYDFLDIAVGPGGEVWLALVDLCNDACAEADGTSDDLAFGRAAVSVQTGGALLRGAPS